MLATELSPPAVVTEAPTSMSDAFLQELIEAKREISIYMLNGIQLKGYLKAFDQYSLQLEGHGSQLIYKHAISTIMQK